jgi:group I intron endonuclease
MLKFGFIYIWTNNINGMKYIGKCWGDPNSSYIGSGKYFRHAVKKFGIKNFEREILEYCYTKSHLKEREQYWLDYYNAALDKNFYNISPHAGGGHHGANYKGENNPMWGKKHPNHKPHYGKENGMYGVHRFLSENPNAKSYFIVDDDGKEYYTTCLKEFVKDRFPLDNGKIYQSLKEQAIRGTFKPAQRGHCKGWKIKHEHRI